MNTLDIQKLTTFFLWCTIINAVILAVATLGIIVVPEFGTIVQSRLFDVPPEMIPVLMYGFLGIYKALWLIFNLGPYLALLIMRNR